MEFRTVLRPSVPGDVGAGHHQRPGTLDGLRASQAVVPGGDLVESRNELALAGNDGDRAVELDRRICTNRGDSP